MKNMKATQHVLTHNTCHQMAQNIRNQILIHQCLIHWYARRRICSPYMHHYTQILHLMKMTCYHLLTKTTTTTRIMIQTTILLIEMSVLLQMKQWYVTRTWGVFTRWHKMTVMPRLCQTLIRMKNFHPQMLLMMKIIWQFEHLFSITIINDSCLHTYVIL